MARDVKEIKKDRLRYTLNTASSSLVYLGILFGVLYFVSIYQSNVGTYYYNMTIGFSIVYNLIFLLVSFLSSEGLKNYKIGYAYTIIAIGLLQIARIYGIPTRAHSTVISLEDVETLVMSDEQFTYCSLMLILSAAACILAGIIGIYKSTTLKKYMIEKGLE